MQVESLRLIPHIELHVSGAPYYAARRTIRGSLPPHRNHDYAEFTAIVAGRGRVVSFVDGREPRVDPLLPGQLHLFRPIDVHQHVADESGALTLYNIAFPMTSWLTFMQLAGLDPALMTSARPPVLTFDPADPDWLGPHIRALDRFWHGPTMVDLLEFWNAMAARFTPRSASTTASPGAPVWLGNALEQMRDEGNLRRGMDRFVELSHVSPAHLSRTAMRYCGMTPTQLLGQLRMWRAAMLLATTPESVGAIAERVGFGSASYFTKAFRAAHLVSPRQYRRRLAALDAPTPGVASGQ